MARADMTQVDAVGIPTGFHLTGGEARDLGEDGQLLANLVAIQRASTSGSRIMIGS